MSQAKDKLVHNPINANSTTDELQFSIFWITEDEMIGVEGGQLLSPNTASHCCDVIHIWFLNHSAHGIFD